LDVRRGEDSNVVLPYMDRAPLVQRTEKQEMEVMEWPDVLDPKKINREIVTLGANVGDSYTRDYAYEWQTPEGRAGRKLLETYIRMRDVERIIRFGMSDPPADGRGLAAVGLCHLKRFKEAAQLAAGPDGNTPCGIAPLRYIAHEMARHGAIEAAKHLSKLQLKLGKYTNDTAGLRMFQCCLESYSLYLQATATNQPRLLGAHGHMLSLELEKLLEYKSEIFAVTPHKRFTWLTEPFNQLIRWLGRARLVPQQLRACEIMNELNIPRNDMTIHFLSKGCAPSFRIVQRRSNKPTNIIRDKPQLVPEVVLVGRVNSGKSAMINALLSQSKQAAKVSKIRCTTRTLQWFQCNQDMAGLPSFNLVDTPGLGHAEQSAHTSRGFPDLLYEYFKNRESLVHIFFLIDARNKRLLPADKQLLHLIAKAQRRRVKLTFVITKIDVVSRKRARDCAKAIKDELAPHFDADIMFASPHSLRGIDHMWAKIWPSITNNPRGRRHINIGPEEVERLYSGSIPEEGDLAELLGLPREPEGLKKQYEEEQMQDYTEWEDEDFDPEQRGKDQYFDDKWEGDEEVDLESFGEASAQNMADLQRQLEEAEAGVRPVGQWDPSRAEELGEVEVPDVEGSLEVDDFDDDDVSVDDEDGWTAFDEGEEVEDAEGDMYLNAVGAAKKPMKGGKIARALDAWKARQVVADGMTEAELEKKWQESVARGYN